MDERLPKKQKNCKGFIAKLFHLRYKGMVILLAVIMIVLSQGIPSFADEIDKAKDDKATLEQKKEETELKLKELEKEKDDILNYIEKLDAQLSELSDEVEDLNVQIKDANEELKETEADLDVARQKEQDQYATMKKRIQYMYENGNTSVIEIILKSDNISDMLNQIEYMSKITEYDNGLLDEYKELKDAVTQREEDQKEQLEHLNSLKDELAFEQETVEQLVQDKSAEVIKYEASIGEAQTLSDEYTNKIKEQEDLIEDLLEAERKRIEEEEQRKKEEAERLKKEQEEAAKNNQSQNNDSSNGGQEDSGSTNISEQGFIWPCPSSTRITSPFGNRSQPTEGASTYHKGIDIGASTGSTIVAAADGTVVTAAYSVTAGNYIMISHGNSIYTVYMHCSKLLVSVGDTVKQGDTIGLVGSTGVSTGSHLHFGVSVNGEYVNPLNYVSY